MRSRLCVAALLLAGIASAQNSAPVQPSEPRLLTIEGVVRVFPVKGSGWVPAQTNQILHVGDRLQTGARSRATIRQSDLTVMRVDELTTQEIPAPERAGKSSGINLRSGAAYLFSREKATEQGFHTPVAAGAIRGTEFNLAVAQDGRTEIALIDGEVSLSNSLGQITMVSGEKAIVEPGKAPVKTAMLEAINNIQWCLYYPGILDTRELELSAEERQALAASVSAYKTGDLLQAVARFPEGRPVGSDSEQVYRAATLLSAGQADQAEVLLARFQTDGTPAARAAKLAAALRQVIAVVKGRPGPRAAAPTLATEWLAESYVLQAQAQLRPALEAARASVAKSPEFGFGWARVAELEQGFGRLPAAKAALEKSLHFSPRNPQSLAVKGFILLAQRRVREAQASFEEAMALDGGLGNAWLGRGLCQLWHGHKEAGRQDLQVAAVLEPQRAVLRSYLGKAFSNAGDNRRATKELALAQRFDAHDPTAWLYLALVEQQENEINQAVRDLEESEKLNDNRRLFRSKLLLDEDEAVRGANLANIYQDTGIFNWQQDVSLSDWSVREASQAVNYDYANFAAHKFLANSYDSLRDPQRINLRYETPWASELLLSFLLAPVGAGNLSEFNSQQPYARLFEQSHFGVSSDTEYLSHGDWLERGSQFGTFGDITYAVDAEYRSNIGWRQNNDLDQLSLSARAKAQLTPQDSLYVEGSYFDSTFGDVAQYYNQFGTISNMPAPSAGFRGNEKQEPNVFLGYHHEWGPGSHTLFLGSYLNDTLKYSDPAAKVLFTANSFGTPVITALPVDLDYSRHFEAYTAELQQIWQTERQTLVAGGRYQSGWNDTSSTVVESSVNAGVPLTIANSVNTDLERYSFYAYETVKPWEPLQLTAGVSYDHLTYPTDIDTSPITSDQSSIDQVSPKAGIIWAATRDTHLRFAYTRSLGGVFYDTSVRLEPSQVAGFNQAFRSIIPESAVGLVPGTRFTTYGLGLDQSFKSSTYLTIDGEILDSDATRTVGALTNQGIIFPVPNGSTHVRQNLDFTEKSLLVSLNQLVGREWSLGGRYQLSYAELHGSFDLPPSQASSVNQDQNATLQQLILYVNYYHPCGFFSQFQTLWTHQDNGGYSPSLPGDDFWQFNIYAGYRFLRHAAEVKLGLLNMTGQDYQLNPLNLYYDLPRQRTLAVSFKFYF